MFERNAELELKKWHGGKNRKPLVIRGARQVGRICYLHLQPLSFEEYLKAIGKNDLSKLISGGDYYRHPRLHYWLREGRQANAEIDFLIEAAPSIIPVEVKSGASGSLKSLHQFVAVKKSPFAFRLDLNAPSLQQISVSALTTGGSKKADYPLYSLPLYLACQVERIAKAKTY
jgi:hypothetical protein